MPYHLISSFDYLISSTKYDPEETCLEFENYVLELTVSMGEKHNDSC